MADTSLKARKAIYDKLVATAGVTALVNTRIYQVTAPSNAAYPYIVIGDRTTDQRFKTKDFTVQSHRIRLYMYSRTGVNTMEAIENLKAVVFSALEKATLTISGSAFVDCMQEGLDDSVIMPDGRTQRAILEFTVTLQ